MSHIVRRQLTVRIALLREALRIDAPRQCPRRYLQFLRLAISVASDLLMRKPCIGCHNPLDPLRQRLLNSIVGEALWRNQLDERREDIHMSADLVVCQMFRSRTM